MKRFYYICLIVLFISFCLLVSLFSTCGDSGNNYADIDTTYVAEEDHDYGFNQPIVYSSDSSTITFHPMGFESSFKMIRVEGGVFTMGNNDEPSSKPEHEVELSTYYIAETEVTIQLWEELMGSDGAERGRNFSPLKPKWASWFEAQDFIETLNKRTGQLFRMPTEAEWEFAAKGGKKSNGYWYSGSNNIDNVAWYSRNAYGVGANSYNYGTNIVGTKSPNELGIYDMSGNVWEWCQDQYDDYTRKRQKNPTGPNKRNGSIRVVRGGCFHNSRSSCTVTYRTWRTQKENHIVGIRLALSKVIIPEIQE